MLLYIVEKACWSSQNCFSGGQPNATKTESRNMVGTNSAQELFFSAFARWRAIWIDQALSATVFLWWPAKAPKIWTRSTLIDKSRRYSLLLYRMGLVTWKWSDIYIYICIIYKYLFIAWNLWHPLWVNSCPCRDRIARLQAELQADGMASGVSAGMSWIGVRIRNAWIIMNIYVTWINVLDICLVNAHEKS